MLVTGSDDATIFIFNIHTINNYPTIIPIGYVKLPSSITCMAWNPQEVSTIIKYSNKYRKHSKDNNYNFINRKQPY